MVQLAIFLAIPTARHQVAMIMVHVLHFANLGGTETCVIHFALKRVLMTLATDRQAYAMHAMQQHHKHFAEHTVRYKYASTFMISYNAALFVICLFSSQIMLVIWIPSLAIIHFCMQYTLICNRTLTAASTWSQFVLTFSTIGCCNTQMKTRSILRTLLSLYTGSLWSKSIK